MLTSLTNKMEHRNLFDEAIERIDAANAQDPNVTNVGGVACPHELHYSIRITEWLDRLAPSAPEALRLAVRCQHMCRWMIPRSQYPMTRAGYHRWRTDLGRFHADRAADILRLVGYDEPFIGRVQSLIRKEGLATDPDTQTLEDVACLVFLEDEFADFSARHEEPKVIHILARTWGKMSPRGRSAALGLNLPAQQRALIEKALTTEPSSD